MDQIGMFEAKTHFSEIVQRVLKEGRPITITRRGQPVVDITPTRSQRTGRMSRQEALVELGKLRGEVASMTRAEILALVAEGRGR
jgi:prevent-host-death family protein